MKESKPSEARNILQMQIGKELQSDSPDRMPNVTNSSNHGSMIQKLPQLLKEYIYIESIVPPIGSCHRGESKSGRGSRRYNLNSSEILLGAAADRT
jgi:hypothetical protein